MNLISWEKLNTFHRNIWDLANDGTTLAFYPWGYFPLPAREDEVGIRVGWRQKLFSGAALLVLAGSLANAQQTVVEEGKRKVKTRVNPSVPELARRMNISGKVRIEVVIASDGHVKSARALGGHPVLVQPCLEAAEKWKFDSAPEESTQILEFSFKEQ